MADRLEVDVEDRTCVRCGATFTPKRQRSRACSRKCNKILNRDNPARQCSEGGCDRPTTAKGLCHKHYKASHPNGNGTPATRQARWNRNSMRRRAKLLGVAFEVIHRDEIGERDRWKCGLCYKPIQRSLKWPDAGSASLDHIVPLSEGGGHLKTNVHIAHLKCNLSKGPRGGGEQLLLIG